MDITAAYAKIKAAVPHARFRVYDYDQSLSVAHPTARKAFIVFQVARHEIGQIHVEGDVDQIIKALRDD